MDIGYVIPSGADVKISSGGVPTTDPSYIDAVDAADKFGKTAYPNFTFARFGWLF
jgi:hypothetical protein